MTAFIYVTKTKWNENNDRYQIFIFSVLQAISKMLGWYNNLRRALFLMMLNSLLF